MKTPKSGKALPKTKKVKEAKIGRVIKEFKTQKLKSSSGQLVKKKSQAIAIALNESRKEVASHLHPKSIFTKKIPTK